MPRRPRSAIPAYAYHVMNRSIRQVSLFSDPGDYSEFLDILARGLRLHPVEVLAFCLMPNHWHFVLRGSETTKLSSLLHWLTTTHARHWHHVRHTTGLGPVYKGRFLSIPLAEEADVLRVCRYVERNPLRAGLVERAERWQWSSLHERRTPDPAVPLVCVPVLAGLAWVDFVNQPASRGEEDEMAQVHEPPEEGVDQATG